MGTIYELVYSNMLNNFLFKNKDKNSKWIIKNWIKEKIKCGYIKIKL